MFQIDDLENLLSVYYVGRWCPWRFNTFQPEVKRLEQELNHWYPLGEDYFKISHGPNYWTFFQRLGKLTYQTVWLDDRIVATAAGVRRKVDVKAIPKTNQQIKTWYLCDLKVHPDYRGRRLPAAMLVKAFPVGYLKCQRAYGISMNPNRIGQLIQHSPAVKNYGLEVKEACQLNLYSLDYNQMCQVADLLRQARGEIGYLSLTGIKDIILKSTGQPMKLLHVQFGSDFRRKAKLTKKGWDNWVIPDGQRLSLKPQPDHQHMWCCPATDPLVAEMEQRQIPVHSTATVYHHEMDECDWTFILTSDI